MECNRTLGLGVLRLVVASAEKSELRFKIEYRYRGLLFHYILYCFGLLQCIRLTFFVNNGLTDIQFTCHTIHLFKVYNSVVSYYHILNSIFSYITTTTTLERLQHPKINPVSICHHSPFPFTLPTPSPATASLLPPCLCRFASTGNFT